MRNPLYAMGYAWKELGTAYQPNELRKARVREHLVNVAHALEQEEETHRKKALMGESHVHVIHKRKGSSGQRWRQAIKETPK